LKDIWKTYLQWYSRSLNKKGYTAFFHARISTYLWINYLAGIYRIIIDAKLWYEFYTMWVLFRVVAGKRCTFVEKALNRVIIIIRLNKFPLISLAFFLVWTMMLASEVHAQSPKKKKTKTSSPAVVNLISNGDFELGNYGFTSEYRYDDFGATGSYVVTNNAPLHHADFANPTYGDHTKGRGSFLIANADGRSGRKLWCGNVKVKPNTRYEFTAYFCNVFALLPSKTNFAFDEGDVKGNDPELKVTIGSEVIALEKDFFHLFRWVAISGTWYSDGHSSNVDVCIENTNTSVFGNDVALDDISFIYLETMPEGYQPPKKTVTLVDRYYVAPLDSVKKKVPLSTYGEFEYPDTVTEGVYVLHPKPWRPIMVDPLPSVTKVDSIIERIALHRLSFDQTKAELKSSAMAELDLVALWMMRDKAVRIRFIGHTDNQGDPILNIRLSEERVLNVKKYLLAKGIAAERIETVGYGGAFPIADNLTEESRKLNRRVEMEILSK
jgi:outer membrane protein OmpA-like peptidoglycan-associated protein